MTPTLFSKSNSTPPSPAETESKADRALSIDAAEAVALTGLKELVVEHIMQYVSVDNPEPKTTFEKWTDTGQDGRERVKAYLLTINDFDIKTVNQLLKKLVDDFCDSSLKSALNSSTKLRGRIGDALLEHFKISKYDIDAELRRQYTPAHSARNAFIVGHPDATRNSIIRQMIEKAFAQRLAPKPLRVIGNFKLA